MDSFTIVIFGAAGDLTTRKLIPALLGLVKSNRLTNEFKILAIARREITENEYRQRIRESLKGEDAELLESFCNRIFYLKADFDKPKQLEHLKSYHSDNLLFYLATPPSSAPTIIKLLDNLKLKQGGWRKIIIEKPYGADLSSAKILNNLVSEVFNEEQVYRIDHYLAKETVQNFLVFRFGNGMFEPLWNNKHIDHIQLTIAEDFGVRTRGRYYEQSGLLRDIIQNHGLQLLALIAMEPPVDLSANSIRDKKVKVLRAIRKMSKTELNNSLVLGQYCGYRQEAGVAPDSNTETFAAVKFLIDNARWKGVPFFIRAGKNLKKTLTELIIRFKKPPHNLFGSPVDNCKMQNELIIQVQPTESISLRFGAKRPGAELIADPVTMDFNYRDSFGSPGLTPYHRLIYDAILGDQTRFVRSDGIEESWRITDNLREFKDCSDINVYEPQTWGPKSSGRIFGNLGCQWAQEE